MDKFVGKRLDGRYEIQEIIGIGGMAVVYKAHDTIEDRTVAIKILKEEFTSNAEFVRRFKNESKAIAMLSHPNIVKVYDVSFGDLIQYIVMEYIDGITLKEVIERQGSLRWRDAVHFANQILKGLQHAHDKGIVHRDVKPQNISGLPDHTIKVTDFGIARFARSEQRTITDKAIGSVHYISPEQARGERTDEKADIYSVGVILYEMLTGQVPFQAESAVSVAIMQLQREPKLPTEINPSIPAGLEQITMHAMQKCVERRYQTAAEMLCDLDAFRKDPEKTFAYTVFVDNSPTKYVDVGSTGGAASEDAIPPVTEPFEDPTEDDSAPEKSNVIPILTGVAVTLLIVIGIVAWNVLSGILKPPPKSIACPSFIGMTEQEVKASKDYSKFKITFKEEASDDEDVGKVFDQTPNGGMVRENSKIVLKIGRKRSDEETVVPDIVGKNEPLVKSDLRSKNLEFERGEDVYSDEVEAGLAVSCDPEIGSTVYIGDTITVSFSKGPEPIEVPSVIGNNSDVAKEKIEASGLKIKILKGQDLSPNVEYKAKDVAFKQSPAAGSSAAPGGTVTVYLSSGRVAFNSFGFTLSLDAGGSQLTGLSADLDSADGDAVYFSGKPSVKYDAATRRIVVSGLNFRLDEPCGSSNVIAHLLIKGDVDGYQVDLFRVIVNAKSGEVRDQYQLYDGFLEAPIDDSGDTDEE
ncbi:MAG: Stk1 family PASTA domain-containing Ser/Thr kinase [Clostridia bacterium]|nr:Stk1 family PASTA domain-containing Ser/Thr kinase [Clostridia bacterium]